MSDDILIRELLIGAAMGFLPLAIWRLASSLWGWYRCENYYYDSRRKALYWDRARFRHGLGALTVLLTALLGYAGWHFMAGNRLIAYLAGLLLSFFFPLPAHGPVLLFKLWRIDPPMPRPPGRPSASGRHGRDP